MSQSVVNQSLKIERDKLPSMPQALLQLLEVISDPEVDFQQITDLIQSDPALTFRVLSVANSAANYPANQNRQLNHIIVSLGLKTVKTIVSNAAVQQFFSHFNVDDKGLLAQFWQTSLLTAGIAKALAHTIGSENEDEAYIAGLLHKLGELVCLAHNKDDYSDKVSAVLNNNTHDSLYERFIQLSDAEHAFIGASIPEIGAMIVSDIAGNSFLGDAILFQREPAEQISGASHLLQVINIAQKLAAGFADINASEIQLSDYKAHIFHEASSLFDLSQPLLEDMLKQCYEEFLNSAKTMGINVNEQNKIAVDDHDSQIQLAEKVRSIALSSSLQQFNNSQTGRTEQQLILQIMQQLNLLFDLSNSLYLAFDEQSRVLTGRYVNNIAQAHAVQLKIPLTAEMTLPVQSVLKKKPVTSKDKSVKSQSNLSVLDRQLLHLLNTRELLCIPLIDSTDNNIHGVLVSAVSASQLKKIQREKGLIYEFSKASSEVISHDKKIAEQIQSALEQEKSLHSLEIRKLVHEANNPLGVIRNYLQILSLKMAESADTKLQGQLEILGEEVERIGQIILRIRDTPEQTDLSKNQININELLRSMVTIFEQSLFVKAGIIAQFNLDKAIPPIKSNINSLKQIITNLLKNATEAMPDGGTIYLKTRDQVNYNGSQFIELSISDTGPGISDDILKNLFKPVKSTKTGEHSGLGLSIIKNLVNDLGGTISGSNLSARQLSSTSAEQAINGAEFVILLPRKLFENQTTAQ